MFEIEMIGGSLGSGIRQPIPILREQDLPPYICSGHQEPYEHFMPDETRLRYLYMGLCVDIPHPHGYPHHPAK